MRLPSKLFSYRESTLVKFPAVLSVLERRSYGVRELYEATKANLENVGEFMEVVDCLYALGKIKYDSERRHLVYVN